MMFLIKLKLWSPRLIKFVEKITSTVLHRVFLEKQIVSTFSFSFTGFCGVNFIFQVIELYTWSTQSMLRVNVMLIGISKSVVCFSS